ncbi:MAG: site-specific integrase [Rhodospirillales bacterium]|nr:site-specific integrase [Rhodospirillales bacterium]
MAPTSPPAPAPAPRPGVPPAITPVATLADVIAHLQADPALPVGRRRELISALRTTARLFGLDPAAVPAEPRALRQRFRDLSSAAAGVSQGRWNNLRSLVLAALKQAGVRVLPGRAPDPLSPAWQALRDRLPDRTLRYGLSRFLSFCSTRDIGPAAVGAATFAAFAAALERDSLTTAPDTAYRRTCTLWNNAVRTVPGWPDVRVALPGDSRRYALDWAAFPESFRADAHVFLYRMGNQDPFADDYAVSVRPSTVQLRRKQILEIATALVRSGVPASTVTGLATLAALPHAKLALRFFLDRAGGTPTKYLHQHALLLKTIARHWVKADRDHVEALGELCRRLAVKHTGLVEKNRIRLRQFDNPANVVALVTLPRQVMDDVARHDDGDRRVALRAMLAVAVELLIAAPMRADNLAGLHLDRHLVRTRAGAAKTLHLVIPAEETKNGAPYEMQLPVETERLLATYLARYRSRVSPEAASPWLFPNAAGERRSTIAFTQSICAFVRRETGLRMNVHLFRHTAVKLHLEAHPEDIETARRLLGHKSVTTTLRSYAETRTAAAFRRYDEVLRRLREPVVTGARLRRAAGGRS